MLQHTQTIQFQVMVAPIQPERFELRVDNS